MPKGFILNRLAPKTTLFKMRANIRKKFQKIATCCLLLGFYDSKCKKITFR